MRMMSLAEVKAKLSAFLQEAAPGEKSSRRRAAMQPLAPGGGRESSARSSDGKRAAHRG